MILQRVVKRTRRIYDRDHSGQQNLKYLQSSPLREMFANSFLEELAHPRSLKSLFLHVKFEFLDLITSGR